MKRKYPSWYGPKDKKAVAKFIRECPVGYHIDHIIPVNGANVCGLHVLENLQWLPATDNLLKRERLVEITLEHVVCPMPISPEAKGFIRKSRKVRKTGGAFFDYESARRVAEHLLDDGSLSELHQQLFRDLLFNIDAWSTDHT